MEPAGRKPDQLEVALRKQQCPELIFVSQDVAGRGRPSFASPVSRQIRSAGRRGCIQRDGGQWHRGLATARGSKRSTAFEIDRGQLEGASAAAIAPRSLSLSQNGYGGTNERTAVDRLSVWSV